jgi:DNA-binding CsgD family transcriptional regulator
MNQSQGWALSGDSNSNDTLMRGAISWQLLDQVGCGICVVDDSLRLTYSNAIADEMMFIHWFTVNGVPPAANDSCPMRLRDAVQGALRGRPSILQFFESGTCIVLAVSPIQIEHNQPSVLITSERLHAMQSITFRMYAKALRLTPKEIEVLTELTRGREPKAVALDMNLSIETVRSHIKAMLGKASANSLRELLLRVATLPPIVLQNALETLPDSKSGNIGVARANPTEFRSSTRV